jgi:hypothetical protein
MNWVISVMCASYLATQLRGRPFGRFSVQLIISAASYFDGNQWLRLTLRRIRGV